jgi:CDP-diacylglycerol--serine O-phosphatidyltransferase
MGEQLDSLSDVVSFGVAPGMILYQLLRISYAQDESGLDTTMAALLPAFVYSAAVAWRLAKFNISTNQQYNFEGVPSPAAALVVASFPLIILYRYYNLEAFFINRWFLYGTIFVLSYLMLSRGTFIAIKFTDFSFKNNLLKYILISVSLIAVVSLQWLAVPIIFIAYVILSLFSNRPNTVIIDENKEMTDITV